MRNSFHKSGLGNVGVNMIVCVVIVNVKKKSLLRDSYIISSQPFKPCTEKSDEWPVGASEEILGKWER